jgi:hypothetical protein
MDSKENIRRQEVFNLSMAVLNTPGVNDKDRERAEVELERHFGLPKIVYLVGVDHQVQHDGPTMILEREKATSDFCQFLETKANEFHITLIAEELNEDALKLSRASKSTVQDVAKRLGLIHLFCDPTIAERKQLRIHKDQDLREEHWLSRLSNYRDGETILFVCGADHLETFSKKLTTTKRSESVILPEKFGIGLPAPILPAQSGGTREDTEK